ncbi:MAG: hypothetical protein KA049_04145 [Burkholderiales bacterium]|nr:hypothetical protein [Burkholderiales bacterium]MBP9769761.1 hypothetical protein [Burkholderiales bacterium]
MNLSKFRSHNPHMNIMFIGLMFLFYHYYNFSLEASDFANKFYSERSGLLAFIFTVAPYTFSSLMAPIGGLIFTKLQKQSKNYIFPYIFLADSLLSLLSNLVSHYIYVPKMLYIALACRLLQGALLGGMLPQYVIYIYAKSHGLNERVNYGNLFFILFYLAIMAAIIGVNFFSASVLYHFNWYFSGAYIALALLIFSYRGLWHNFHIENISINHSWSLRKTWRHNRSSILRFTFFITFMASLNAYFVTVMPYFLVKFLHYSVQRVYFMQLLIISCGIVGFIVGGIFHTKIGRKFHLTLGLIIKLLIFIMFHFYVSHDFKFVALIGAGCLFCCGLMASKILVILNSIFAVPSRLYGIALTYNLSWGLMFGFSGFVVMRLMFMFNDLYIPSLLIMFFSYVSLISLWFTPEKDFFRYLEAK